MVIWHVLCTRCELAFPLQASDAPAGPSSQLSSTNCGGPLSATTPTSLGSLSQSSVGSTQLSPPISISQKAGIPFLSGQLPFSAKNTPQPSSTSSASLKQTNLNVSGTPGSATTVVTSIPNPRVAVTAAPIQPGMVTPLPPGLNLEALSKLCSLPESELLKHNLPPNLLTAIKVWKLQQKSEPQSSLFKSAVSILCTMLCSISLYVCFAHRKPHLQTFLCLWARKTKYLVLQALAFL